MVASGRRFLILTNACIGELTTRWALILIDVCKLLCAVRPQVKDLSTYSTGEGHGVIPSHARLGVYLTLYNEHRVRARFEWTRLTEKFLVQPVFEKSALPLENGPTL